MFPLEVVNYKSCAVKCIIMIAVQNVSNLAAAGTVLQALAILIITFIEETSKYIIKIMSRLCGLIVRARVVLRLLLVTLTNVLTT